MKRRREKEKSGERNKEGDGPNPGLSPTELEPAAARGELEIVKEGEEEKKPLKGYRIIPYFLARRDGRHSVIMTRQPIDEYMFEFQNDVFLNWMLVRTRSYRIFTRLAGTFPDLENDKGDGGEEGYRVLRPVTSAGFTKQSMKDVAADIELTPVSKDDVAEAINAKEAFQSVKTRRLYEHALRELQTEREANLEKTKLSRESIHEAIATALKWHERGVRADRQTKVELKQKVKYLFRPKMLILWILIVAFTLFALGVV